MPKKVDAKHPADRAKIVFNWSGRLPPDDVILSTDWTLETPLALSAQAVVGLRCILWLTGGTLNTEPRITLRMTSQAGYDLTRSVLMPIRDL